MSALQAGTINVVFFFSFLFPFQSIKRRNKHFLSVHFGMKPTYQTMSKKHYVLGLETVFQYPISKEIQKTRKEAFLLYKKGSVEYSLLTYGSL